MCDSLVFSFVILQMMKNNRNKYNKKIQLSQCLLTIIIIILIIFVNNVIIKMVGTTSTLTYIVHSNKNNTDELWYSLLLPYKPIYGLSRSFKCHETIYNEFYQCEQSSRDKWYVTINDYFYETKKFCCFVWDAMDCEIDIAKKCNENYSQKLLISTKQTFQTICDKIGSGHKSLSCLWNPQIQMYFAIAIGIISIILTIILCGIFGYQAYKSYKNAAPPIVTPTGNAPPHPTTDNTPLIYEIKPRSSSTRGIGFDVIKFSNKPLTIIRRASYSLPSLQIPSTTITKKDLTSQITNIFHFEQIKPVNIFQK
ncbi:uncharacterized protein LOC142645828 [Dermatophagoides pteronyssinus]|uniref:uncharacterized protein LOC142645828 n=1 Tax=Dermatophagoides pteronyssinus TaxID=6956 RepID=UPI003F66928B